MPNTLVHLGIQGIATRLMIREADYKWIFTGAILPDIPWILKRAVTTIVPGVDPIDLRLYAIAQSSLAGCLFLAGALAIFSRRPWRVFFILVLNSLIHLLLDAC